MTQIQQQFFGFSQREILRKPQSHSIKIMLNFKRQFFLLFFCLFLINFCCVFGKISANFTEEMLEEMEEDEEEMSRLRAGLQHNPKMPPVVVKGDPLRVFAGIYIESMSNFQAAQMSFDVDLYLYANWRDPSLNHSSRTLVLVNDPRVREKIWLPDLYVANAKTSKFHEVTAPNFNLFIANDGEIASSTRITMNVAYQISYGPSKMRDPNAQLEFNEVERAKISVPLLLRANGQNRKNSEFSIEEEEWERCQRLAKEYDQSSVDIDYCSRFLFPATFAIWNAFYWGYYLWYTAPN